MRRKLIIVAAGLMIAGTIAGWFTYAPLRERQLLRQLAAGNDSAIEPLQHILDQSSPNNTRLVNRIAEDFGSFTPHGQLAALRLAESQNARPEAALIVRAGLSAADPAVRTRAVTLAAAPGWNLAHEAVELLTDASADVRRATLKAVVHHRDIATDELLLPLLHDADADLRNRVESTLRARGLRDKDIQIGRLVSDPSPLKRLEVIRHLPTDAELDPEVWLQKLVADPSPAVRANAACAAMDPTSPLGVNFTERVRQMAQRDPDGTVRQIADYLLRSQQK